MTMPVWLLVIVIVIVVLGLGVVTALLSSPGRKYLSMRRM
jgi:hypothetical protein